MSTPGKKDEKKKKNRLQGGGAKQKKPAAPAAASGESGSVWQENRPDMSAAEEHARHLKALKLHPDEEGEYVMPQGLCLIPNFITEEEEKELAEYFSQQDWDSDTNLERRTQQWGYAFDYGEMTVVSEVRPLPKILNKVLGRMMQIKDNGKENSVMEGVVSTFPYPSMPNQMIVNEYEPGQGIHPHVDRSCFGECVASLALLSDCTFVFDKADGHGCTTDVRSDLASLPSFAKATALVPSSAVAKSIHFPRRALVMMKGEARYQWTHMIPPRPWDERNGVRQSRSRRISLTFRTMTEKALERVGQGRFNLSKAWGGKAQTQQVEGGEP